MPKSSRTVDYGEVRESMGLPQNIDPRTVIYAPSPTIEQWHGDLHNMRSVLGDKRVISSNLRGPIGGAKTTGLVWKPLQAALMSEPCRDGVKRFRATFVRNTYPELVSTCIKTWEEWWGPKRGYPRVKKTSPIEWQHKFVFADGPDIEMTVWFLSMDRPDDARKVRGLETTIICGSEAAELPFEYIEHGPTRCGRVPASNDRPDHIHKDHWPTVYGMFNETNSPPDSSWWYELEVEKPDPSIKFHRQPGGLSKDAENIEHLPGGRRYYIEAMKGKSEPWKKAFVHNEFATIINGLEVWPEFNQDIHVSREPLKILPGEPLWLSFDFGLTPACLIGQVSRYGQLRVLREVVTRVKSTKTEDRDEHGMLPGQMGIIRFAKTMVEPLLQKEFAQYNLALQGTADPGGKGQRSNEKSSLQHLQAVFPFVNPARTNVFEHRRIAVAARFDQLTRGEPMILIDPCCRTLIRGCEGEYQFDQMQVVSSQGIKFKLEPDKQNWTSHICDTLGYLAIDALPPLDYDQFSSPAIPPGRVMNRRIITPGR